MSVRASRIGQGEERTSRDERVPERGEMSVDIPFAVSVERHESIKDVLPSGKSVVVVPRVLWKPCME